MTQRSIQQLVPALTITEGAGVTVHRTIGTPRLRHLDPFLLLDHFASNDPDDYIAGFPDHPHRGFITLTYMLDGHMEHRDSMGNRGDLRAGGIQWMKAASGVIHSEMPQQTDGLMRGFQLWINLPAGEKMSDPQYQEFSAAHLPTIEHDGVRIKIISGEYAGRRGPIDDPHTQVQYLDVSLPPETPFTRRVDDNATVFLYPFEGNLLIGGTTVETHALVVLGPGDEFAVTAGPRGARFILLGGRPLREPIVQYGPFVMNTEQEIRQAFEDYRNNRLVKKRAQTVSG
ncbi:MAG: pirin family protein [Gammaproteobacteria bacterium]|nr:pirin family protein [Gammaproteobacteria bacterium]